MDSRILGYIINCLTGKYLKLCHLGSLPREQAIVKPMDFELKKKKYKYGKVLINTFWKKFFIFLITASFFNFSSKSPTVSMTFKFYRVGEDSSSR